MSELVPFLVIGITTGSLYGLAGLGLVLTYRTSGIFNFAHGALAATSAYLFFTLHFSWGWPWPLATVVTVGVFGVVAGVVLERLARGLAETRQATIVVATVGILLLAQGLLFQAYGVSRRTFPDFLPGTTALRISGVAVSWAQVITVAIGTLSFIALFFFLRASRLGVAMRGVVAAPDLLGLTGVNPVRVRVASWIIGASFAALTGILIAPGLGLDAALLSALVVQAFGAVAIGRFSSLPLTYLGGLMVGVLASVGTKYLSARPPLNGIPAVVPFLVLVVVLVASPARALPKGAGRNEGAVAGRGRLPLAVRIGGTAVAAGALLAVPAVVGPRLPAFSTGLVFVVLFLSLSLLTRISGQISLSHAAFAAVGAVTFSHLTSESHAPWLVGVAVAGLVTVPVGAVLALVATRLSGVYLALATFGFGLLMENVIFNTWLMFGGRPQGLVGPRPEFGPIHANSDTAFYYVILAVVATCCAVLVGLQRARLGRFLRALADSPTALSTMGLGLHVTRVMVFSLSAFFAGVAGAMYMSQATRLGAPSFTSLNSLLYLAVLVLAGAVSGFVTSAFLAAGMLVVVPNYLTSVTVEVQMILFGGAALAAALVSDGRVDWSALAARGSAWVERMRQTSEELRRRGPVRERALADAAAGTGVES
jgi:branched-subunit amino acid ABC-type transport system permease component